MRNKTKLGIVGGVVLVASTAVGIASAAATGDDDGPDRAIIGSDLEAASAAALAHTGEGRVTDTEVGDEESYYEVEVTLDNGTEVDVQLDEAFTVVGSEAETGGEDDAGE